MNKNETSSNPVATDNIALHTFKQPNMASHISIFLTLRQILILSMASKSMAEEGFIEAIQGFTKNLTKELAEAKYDVKVANSLRKRTKADNTLPEGARDEALCIAAEHEHLHVIEALMTQGIHVSYPESGALNGNRPIQMATRHGKVNSVRALLNTPSVHLELLNQDCNTVIYEAIVAHEPEILRLLIDAGADVDRSQGVEETRTTLINEAVNRDQMDSLQILIEAGAKVNPSHSGVTPLYLAVDKGNTEMVVRLLEAGADPTKSDSRGDLPTPIERARSTGNLEIETCLRNKITNNLASQVIDELSQHKANCENQPGRSKFFVLFNIGDSRKDKSTAIQAVIDALHDHVSGVTAGDTVNVDAKYEAVLNKDPGFSEIIGKLEHAGMLKLQFGHQPCTEGGQIYIRRFV